MRLGEELCRLRHLGGDLLAAHDAEALRPTLAVDEHRALGDQSLGVGPRAQLGPLGEDAVEARARRAVRDAKEEPCQGGGSSGRTATNETNSSADADDDEACRRG